MFNHCLNSYKYHIFRQICHFITNFMIYILLLPFHFQNVYFVFVFVLDLIWPHVTWWLAQHACLRRQLVKIPPCQYKPYKTYKPMQWHTRHTSNTSHCRTTQAIPCPCVACIASSGSPTDLKVFNCSRLSCKMLY